MAYNDSQNENPLPTPNNKKRTASDLIPKFFRTEANKKFLQGTIDQMIQPGVAEKLNGYVGRKTAKAYTPSDNYLGDVTADRSNYQLEPSVVIKDNLDNVTFYKDYNDYIGTLNYFGSNTSNHSRLNSSEYYPWTPHIDWDKFVNFREYYWSPTGPLSVPIRGQSKEVVSTYTVTVEDQGDNIAYVFNDGLTRNPTLKLYRGQTYRFEIDTPGHPMAIAITRSFTPGSSIITAGAAGLRADGLFDANLYDANNFNYDVGEFIVLPDSGSVSFEDDENVSTLYPDGIVKIGEAGEEVAIAYIEKGTIEFTIPFNAPDRLFYISKNDVDTSGTIRIYDIEENTFLDVEEDILGKKYYKSANGVELSNGMKVRFQGDITPKVYEEGQWYVEGVGDKIVLINEKDLIIPSAYSDNILVPYDTDAFDTLPFSNASAYTATKDYLVINRSSRDKSAWSRYNKWFHKDVLIKSYEYNNLSVNIDESFRAKRPIIEFEAGLKLYNYGVEAKQDVDLIDTKTTDVFSTIEGKLGYNIDGIDLADGMRVLFAADTDELVNGKIYQVKFVIINDRRQIALIETEDTEPLDLETILVTQGKTYAGKTFHYHGNAWMLAQEKTKNNQPPLFDLCCPLGNEYADQSVFDSSTFRGTKIFSYKVGTGENDSELGFPLSYRTLENSGDIQFDFNLLSDYFTIQTDTGIVKITTDTANLRKYKSRTAYSWVNAWSSIPVKSKQYVIRQYDATNIRNNNFAIDVFDNSGDLNDLETIVYVNKKIKIKNVDYEIDRINKVAYVRFYNNVAVDDVVLIKAYSQQPKNTNGYYELPISLERNPLNSDLTTFTLGEVNDHVDSIVEEAPNFIGSYPGFSNLRDLGNVSVYGKKFVKHATPLNLPLYHITNKKYNVVKALKYAKSEYSKFKRTFLEVAERLGFDGETKQHVDNILIELNKDKIKSQPFYFSDMLAYGTFNKINYEILDSRIQTYALNESFTLSTLSAKAVNVYLNKEQLIYERDYTFNEDGYLVLDAGQQEGDLLEIYEYESTDGSFIPPTPTKLGMYPKYEPELLIDDTYQTEAPIENKAYKVYGEVASGYFMEGTRGWFYPLYQTKDEAAQADINNGGTGSYHSHLFKGLNTVFYMPNTNGVHAAEDNVEYDAYPTGIPFVRCHDGSYIRAYLDYRDNLLLELEKRIFNNIKFDNEYSMNAMMFLGGDFRNNEFTQEEINRSLLPSFTQWLSLVDNDYTDNFFYDRLNPFTFNYSNSATINDKKVAGFWRGVYKQAYDTDLPHSRPWEMIGYTIKPKWFDEVYGPAPYTSDNLILWRDLEAGKIAEPGNIRYDEKYARPGLTSFIPVDSKGKVKDPQSLGYLRRFILRQSTGNFKFGDHAPVETAWRRSSDFPFAVISAMLINKPSEIFENFFDGSRTIKNLANQKVYKETYKNLKLEDLVFPNTYADEERILASGLINYVYNLIASDILTVYSDYQTEVTSITNQLGFKLGGFTDKQKLNLILDSRSPRQQKEEGGVYVPQENYKIFFNTSSPLDVAVYSGVVVERTPSGWVIRGYNNDNPFFNYYKPLTGTKAVPVTVGGVSENTVNWSENKTYIKDTVVFYNNSFYRATKTFTSGNAFSTDNLAKLSELPIVGGKTALFKRNFNKTVESLAYGTTLDTSQDVVDFLLGYGKYLNELGFEFDFVQEDGTVDNWDKIAREFLFWTTQGWASGTVITLSPAANKFNFQKDYYVVDDINDTFYGYSILQANGEPLSSEFNSLLRDGNSFGIETVNTDEGLYSASLPLVQKEHVVLIDNTTVFNDVVFALETGYRQERIKVTGYRAADWNGGLNIPGFVYDDAKINNWTEWKDYKIGEIVKYKQFYYVAIENVTGDSEFDSDFWYRLNEKPEAELITNFDYRINQFSDFYSLDTKGFDSELQRMAQHLTGYQKRQYLSNIIIDDISQYKFYQGFIQDKGTRNSLDKLFGALGSAGKETLEFYEEWALQVGRFGSTDDIQQVEFNLKQNKIQESPQLVELVNTLPSTNYDRNYRILPHEVFDKPEDYNHQPFPVQPLAQEYIKTGGFVREEDVAFVAGTEEELPLGNVNLLPLGEYIWVTENEDKEWQVYQHISLKTFANQLRDAEETSSVTGQPLYEITIDRWAGGLIAENDIIGVKSATEYNLNGLYIVDSVNLNKIKIRASENIELLPFAEQNFLVTKLRKVRVKDIAEANTLAQEDVYDKQKFWIEDYNGDWKVIENDSVYVNKQSIINNFTNEEFNQEFSNNIVSTTDNKNVFVSQAGHKNGVVNYYRRSNENWNLLLDQEISSPDKIDDWESNTSYVVGDIVVYDVDSTRTYYRAIDKHTSGNLFDDDEISSHWIQFEPEFYYDPTNARFGESIDVSPDGNYLIVGAPNASYVKTRLAYRLNAQTGNSTFDFQKDASYAKGDIIRHKESIWKVNREILPEIAAQPFSTFDSYINISGQEDSDSTTLTLLVAGDPGLEDNIVDHFLVQAPKDMYNGTRPGDKVNLAWNATSFAYPTLDTYVPFDGDIPEITQNFITDLHEIQEKVDHIFFIDTYVSLPEVGDFVETDTGSAQVVYVSVNRDSAVIYLNETNGIFSITGELFNSLGNFVGFYTEENTYSTSDSVQGYWLIKTYNFGTAAQSGYSSELVDAEGFTYSNNGRYYDVGRGLVYADIVKSGEDEDNLNVYVNIQDTITQIGQYVNRKNQASFINHLSFFGDNEGDEKKRETSKYVIRAPKGYSDIIQTRVDAEGTTDIKIEFFDRTDDGLLEAGFTPSDINGIRTVEDLWDGFIEFDFTTFDFQGNVFEPVPRYYINSIGQWSENAHWDTIEDVQTPKDGQGGLARTNTTTSSAEVMYYQRNFNKIRVYVKVTSGTWEQLTNIGRFEIRRQPNENIRGAGDPTQVMGTVENVLDDIAIGTNLIGKLLLVDAGNNFLVNNETWDEIVPVIDQEYYFYNEDTVDGITRAANPPHSLNKDYTQIYNIPADKYGSGGYENQGAVTVYARTNTGEYKYLITLVSEYPGKDKQFGYKVKISQVGDTYKLMISNRPTNDARNEPLEWRDNPGSIEIYNHGPLAEGEFKGTYRNTSYTKDDIVIWRDDYYIALKDSDQTEDNIRNPIYWNKISWRRGKDRHYRGLYDGTSSYRIGDIVVYNNKIYQSLTNLASSLLPPSSTLGLWTELDSKIDYLGYLPNLTANLLVDQTTSATVDIYGDENFDPLTNIEQFAEDFELSDDYQVLVVKSKQILSDSTHDTKLVVYHLQDNKYVLNQVINAPESSYALSDHDLNVNTPEVLVNKNKWADNIALNPDGTKLAVTVPLDDAVSTDQGAVWIYNFDFVNSVFGKINGEITEPNTIINSPNNEEVEKFGRSISFGKDSLAISSINGDQKIPTRFDTFETRVNDSYVLDTASDERPETTFDNNFTTFKNIKVDKGVVYVFENIEDTLLYSEQLSYFDTQFNFGENILVNDNHIYLGMPDHVTGDRTGLILDFRKAKDTFAWKEKRSSVTPVDISKIKGMFLYNKRTNEIISYVDYIDPVQGKIAGIVEQELTYKIGTDPAFYNVGLLADPTVDPASHWSDKNVGQTWWDISKARYNYPYQGSPTFQKNQWNTLLPGSSINVYEWVESDYLPEAWDQLADTDAGIPLGISGKTLYGNDKYSSKLIYDDVAKTFSNKYYFWVEDKKTIPQVENRSISIQNMKNLISSPREQGYRFISFLGNDKFVINNFDKLITSDDIVLNIQYAIRNQKQNTHAQYQIISDKLATSRPHPDIERKWFDSLIGFDTNNRKVPDLNIPVSKRYGIQNRPRQSMFINRTEALKQTVERINLVLSQNLIVDEYNLSAFLEKESAPTDITRKYDYIIDTIEELEFISTNKVTQAVLSPVIVNGRIVRVDIENSGRGYKVSPSYQIEGAGTGAEFELTINNLGQVTGVTVLKQGKDYDTTTKITVRRYSALVNADTTSFNKWAIYEWNSISKQWFRTEIQDYDVTQYWDYVDWYADGYNQFTNVDYLIEGSYELASINDSIGDIVKIKNVGSGGWLLLEKESVQNTEDYTINYKTVGRQNGTIKLKDSLYDYSKNEVGFDNRSYDSAFYDNNPAKELRIILETLRDNVFINDLAIEYNQLFFASLRYVLSEQPRVDWMFKTSFISATHKLGELVQDVTFNYNNLADYQSYVEEAKPYSTVIREFVDNYEKVEPTNSSVTDFDLAPFYDTSLGRIDTSTATITQNEIVGNEANTEIYPRKHWLDNLGYQIKEVKLSNEGSGYTYVPTVEFVGGGGSGAKAKAVLAYGKLVRIEVTNPGSGYTSAPEVIIEGSQDEDGIQAKATAILGNGVVRTPHIRVKFDRLNKTYTFNTIEKIELHKGTGANTSFELPFPMDLNNTKIKVYVDGIEQLRSKYTYENFEDTTKTYVRERGRINFTNPPAHNSEIEIRYQLPLSMLSATDRIEYGYNPLTNMYGKDFAQLMTGIDFGGVEVRSYDFSGVSGWDSKGWYTDLWDEFDDTFEDEIFTADESTIAVQLSQPLENGVIYNVYKREASNEDLNTNPFVRLDDPNYGTGVPVTNINAIMQSITGDGVTDTIQVEELGISLVDGDTLVVRKVTSDGSILPDTNSYDTQLSGGDLAYSTAAGLNAEEIITDGDGFISEEAMAGPEELVPGQIFDTLDIKVYTRESGGQGKIYTQSYRLDTSRVTYDLGTTPSTSDAIIIKLNNRILDESEYTIDWKLNKVTINNTIVGFENNATLNITTVSQAGQNILDFGDYIADGSTVAYETRVRPQEGIDVFVSVNGEKQSITTRESELTGNIEIIFAEAPAEDAYVYYAIFSNNAVVNYSQMKKDNFVGNGTKTNFELSAGPFYAKPSQYNLIVKVGNSILSPGYNIQYTIPESGQKEFLLEVFQQPQGSLLTEDIVVFLNGEQITTPTQWRFDIANSSIILGDDYGFPGDLLEIYVITDGDYSLVSPTTVRLSNPPALGVEVEIYQFSNHDILGIERINYDVVSRVTLQPDANDFVTYQRLSVGEIELRKPAIDSRYVWVVKNGTLLTPNVDYYVTENKDKVQLSDYPQDDDVIDILHFTEEVNQSKFAYRQFKDILNRTHFKRLDASVTELAQPLNYYDLRIEVVDGSELSMPNRGQNLPGIIWINGERIEYFVKEDNTLRQLRRGTLGTGVKETHDAGSKIFDQNISKTVPYRDETIVQNFVADGVTASFELNVPTGRIDEIEVFVGGKRMNKEYTYRFISAHEMDSPEGDYYESPEVFFDNATNKITLKDVPLEDEVVSVVRRKGRTWNEGDKSLSESENSIARFLRAGTSELPE